MSELRGRRQPTVTRDGDEGVTNGTTEVTVVPSPGEGVRRIVRSFHLRNTVGTGRDVTLRHSKGATDRDIFFVNNLGNNSQWDAIQAGGGIVLNATDESLVVLLNNAGAAPWSVVWEDEE